MAPTRRTTDPAGRRGTSPAPVSDKKSSDATASAEEVEHPPTKVKKIVEGYEPDMEKALVHQVQYMDRDEYVKWVHTPHVYPGGRTARFFVSDFLEMFSRTAWYVVPLVWLPISAALIYYNYNGAPLPRMCVLYVTGIIVWTIVEYTLHRWLFHVDDLLPQNGLALTAHFLLHGVHHRIPMDRHRLVMPPALSIPLALLVHGIWGGLVMPNANNETYYTMFAGAVLGYVTYDCMHYWTHHGWKPTPGTYAHYMRNYHMKHHFLADGYRKGFGITSDFWDRLFGTTLDMST